MKEDVQSVVNEMLQKLDIQHTLGVVARSFVRCFKDCKDLNIDEIEERDIHLVAMVEDIVDTCRVAFNQSDFLMHLISYVEDTVGVVLPSNGTAHDLAVSMMLEFGGDKALCLIAECIDDLCIFNATPAFYIN
uniref:ORF1 n=1 Tax=Zoothera dauma adenovirus TaxID=3073259 RepID=A0AA51NQ30_9ADEN|nr:ORF1 [Zoothera dauma adenovirus]